MPAANADVNPTRKILRKAKAKPNKQAREPRAKARRASAPTGPPLSETLAAAAASRHPGVGSSPTLDPRPANPAGPALGLGPLRSGCGGGLAGRLLELEGTGGPDPSFRSDFAFPRGVSVAGAVVLTRREGRRTWIWRRSTRSWPRSTARSATSSAHCSKLTPFGLLLFSLLVES
jgi:hypothetical protein